MGGIEQIIKHFEFCYLVLLDQLSKMHFLALLWVKASDQASVSPKVLVSDRSSHV